MPKRYHIVSWAIAILIVSILALLVYLTWAVGPPHSHYNRDKPCDDIIRYEDGSLVCEITLKAQVNIK